MQYRSIFVAVAVAAVTALLAGCPNKKPTSSPGPIPSVAADPDPHWAVQQNPSAKVALVYVHGVTGDMVGTWTAPNGKTFFDLVNENEVAKGRADAFVYGFPSRPIGCTIS